jgi:hypothetical protein
LKLLFLCTHWHGLAKLRSHIDPTLDIFDNITIKTGAAFRHFANNTCPDFDTRELAREEGQRKRREAKQKGQAPQDTTNARPMPIVPPHNATPSARTSDVASHPAAMPTPSLPMASHGALPVILQAPLTSNSGEETPKFSNGAGTSNRKKKFTLNTYKYHACGDYPNTIRWYGTTDSYSTEIVGFLYTFLCINLLMASFRVNLNTRRPRQGTSGQIESFSSSRLWLLNAAKPA